MRITRRTFLKKSAVLLGGLNFIASCEHQTPTTQIMTVNGWMPASQMGNTLIHEHILVDFIGAKEYDSIRIQLIRRGNLSNRRKRRHKWF